MADMYNKEAVNYFCNEVFPLVQEEVKDVKFTVVGKSPTRTLIELSKKNTNVLPVGYVEDIRPYVDTSAVFVAPIKSGGGTKLKVLNALAMAKPVVTTSVGAEGIEAKDGEHIAIADDAPTFARKVVELLRNPERATRMGKNGRDLILDKYDWRMIAREQDKLYRDIISSYKVRNE